MTSFLPPVMYGLICVALVVFRRRPPDWYDPDFRMPHGPPLAAVGAAASFGLVLAMRPISQAVGVLILAGAAWYRLHHAGGADAEVLP